MDHMSFPPPLAPKDKMLGFYPTDFIVESLIDSALKWFRSTPGSENDVFGRLMMPQVVGRYGERKIAEIASYIRDHEIRVIQSFPIEDTQLPVVSINLGDSSENEAFEGINRYAGSVDVLRPDDSIVSRQEIGYIPIQDSILIGIHASGTPDKAKYLYYFVAYTLASSVSKLESMGYFSITQRATDMSRFNEFLPANIFTRFMTLSMASMPKFKKDEIPMVDSFEVSVST